MASQIPLIPDASTIDTLSYAHLLAKEDVRLLDSFQTTYKKSTQHKKKRHREKQAPNRSSTPNQDGAPSLQPQPPLSPFQNELASAISQVLEIQEKQQQDMVHMNQKLQKVVLKMDSAKSPKPKVVKPFLEPVEYINAIPFDEHDSPIPMFYDATNFKKISSERKYSRPHKIGAQDRVQPSQPDFVVEAIKYPGRSKTGLPYHCPRVEETTPPPDNPPAPKKKQPPQKKPIVKAMAHKQKTKSHKVENQELMQKLLLRQAWYEQQLQMKQKRMLVDEKKASDRLHSLSEAKLKRLQELAEEKLLKKKAPTPCPEIKEESLIESIPEKAEKYKDHLLEEKQERILLALSQHLKSIEEQENVLLRKMEECALRESPVPLSSFGGDTEKSSPTKSAHTLTEKEEDKKSKNETDKSSIVLKRGIQGGLSQSEVDGIMMWRELQTKHLFESVGCQPLESVDPWGIMDRSQTYSGSIGEELLHQMVEESCTECDDFFSSIVEDLFAGEFQAEKH